MKLQICIRCLTIFFSAFMLIGMISCEKQDSSAPFGLTKIYIPQSTSSGGINLNYLVPSGLDSATHNYFIDQKNNKVNVFLGVNRSGKEQADSYSVSIGTRSDTINQLIADSLIKVNPNHSKQVILLPATAYTLPANITVPGGQTTMTFNLAINETMLKTYAGQKVALCVTLSNPTKYSLNTINDKVIIIIDVDALMLP